MTSNIDTSKIDIEYPKPGQDNDSQGFRDNFESIRTNLNTTKTELEDLQTNVARTDSTTDFNSNIVADVNLLAATLNVFDLGNITEDTQINFLNGQLQTVTLGESVTLTIAGWPGTERYSFLRVALKNDNIIRTVNWSAGPNQTLKFDGSWPNTFTVESGENFTIVDFFSFDGGETIHCVYHGKFSETFDEPTIIRDLTVTGTTEIEGNLNLNNLVLPNLSASERDSEQPVLGKLIYNTDAGKVQAYVADSGDGNPGWVDLH